MILIVSEWKANRSESLWENVIQSKKLYINPYFLLPKIIKKIKILKHFITLTNNKKMRSSILFALIVLVASLAPTQSLSCQYLGATGCFLSCAAQNCGGSYCDPNKVCMCNRCSNGPIIQISIGKRDIEPKGTSCNYLGQVGCSASCASQGKWCGGYCTTPGNTCVCNRC